MGEALLYFSLKDYKRLVLWVDYFNSSLSRSEGRRVPLDRSVKDPKLDELTEAAKRAGFSPEPAVSNFPLRMMIKTGYINVEKRSDAKKTDVIEQIAKALSSVRGERSSLAAGSTAKDVSGSLQKGPLKVQHKK